MVTGVYWVPQLRVKIANGVNFRLAE